MKKSGFTLAEVLITLGIIGVVAALTAPALVQNTANAQIGPTLAKVASTIENANQKLMLDEGVSSLYSLASEDSSADLTKEQKEKSSQEKNLKYCTYLSKYIAGSSYETDPMQENEYKFTYYAGNNTGYSGFAVFHFSNSIDLMLSPSVPQSNSGKGSFKGTFSDFLIDVNGLKTGPNSMGKDIFYFTMDNNGKVVPAGSKTYDWAYGKGDGTNTWSKDGSTYQCDEDKVSTSGTGCAGSIFDNNLKVIYQ